MRFSGYRRAEGTVGVRNLVAIVPCTVCANDVAMAIAAQVRGAVALCHDQGCCQLAPDLEQVTRTLVGLGRNPNVAGVLVVSLGCESVVPSDVVDAIAVSGKPVEHLAIQELGGSSKAVETGCRLATQLMQAVATAQREPCEVSELAIGVKCGASDATSGIASNPATGAAIDLVIQAGGSAVFGEVTEMIGAEHVLTRRAATPQVAQDILDAVSRMESRAKSMGVDMRGGQPTAGNIAGGLTTIEEKSLGAIVKAGSAPILGLLKYGESISGKGLYALDMPGREPEALTGLAAAGVNLVLFSTGLGAPQGFPIVPVIKITGNSRTAEHLRQHIDVDVSAIIYGQTTIDAAGSQIYREILAVANGKQTQAEKLGYHGTVNICTLGPVI